MVEGLQLPPFPAPPPWAARYRSDDLDEVRVLVARSFGEHSRVAHRAGLLGFELAWVSGAMVASAWGRVGIEKTVRAARASVLLHLQTPPGTVYRSGRSQQLVNTHEAMLVAPGQEFTRRSPPGQSLALDLDAQRLAAELAVRLAADGTESLPRTGPITLDAPGRAQLAEALRGFVQTAAPGHDPALAAHSEARLVATVADMLLRQGAVVRARPVSGRRLGDLEDWIESHLEEPITLGRLCGVAGIGGRALGKIFESRRGMSPMRFVTERRLAAAHARLLRAGAAGNVTQIASELGFAHQGRFAIAYREAFGESPSQTLRRSRTAVTAANVQR